MNEETIKNILLGDNYYSLSDLKYNKSAGFLLSNSEIGDFFEGRDKLIEEGSEFMVKLPLKTFNSKHIFFVQGKYLIGNIVEYLSILSDDLETNKSSLITRNIDDILMSRIFSEIESSLKIENVATTHQRIEEVCSSANCEDKNDIIIRNMYSAIKYIVDEKPEFNKENLRKLYHILSKDCLKADDELKDGAYYRDDAVYIDKFEGAPCDKIGELMDSLFSFVANVDLPKECFSLLPHICHYYILYVHPYFDYNGRTARMVSFWISYLFNIVSAPLFISEAINEDKFSYYEALTSSRVMGNDITYFLGYVMRASVRFSLLYKNLEEIDKKYTVDGNFLTKSDKMYIKKIMLHNSSDYFNYKMFNEYIGYTLTKQRSLKILNDMTEIGLLVKDTNKRGEAIFKVNQDIIKYVID